MPGARVEPPAGSWDIGKAAFLEVLATSQSEVVIAFSKRLGAVLKLLCVNVPLARVHHPSTGFAYAKWNPVIAAALAEAAERQAAVALRQPVLSENPNFREWIAFSESASPAHGPHLPPEMLAAVHVRWATVKAREAETINSVVATPADFADNLRCISRRC